MEHWTSVVKGRSNTCAVVGNKIFGWNARTFKLHKEINFPSCFLYLTIYVIVPCSVLLIVRPRSLLEVVAWICVPSTVTGSKCSGERQNLTVSSLTTNK